MHSTLRIRTCTVCVFLLTARSTASVCLLIACIKLPYSPKYTHKMHSSFCGVFIFLKINLILSRLNNPPKHIPGVVEHYINRSNIYFAENHLSNLREVRRQEISSFLKTAY